VSRGWARAARIALLAICLLSSRAWASVERYAVVIGNDVGARGDERLRYAQADAEKVAMALGDVGGFPPANVVVLRGSDAAAVRSTLIAVNDRVRSAATSPGTTTLLFVYYSGHADSQALHLGATALALPELVQLVRGSAATFRLLVLDACRSGALTRLKGGSVVAPFALDAGESAAFRGEGMAFLTASAADEDAQESDELRGSFFTHAFVSGLLGAADSDGDGQVVLEEAYRHTYDATLRNTSRTFAGAQHPTFQYDLRGQGDVVLSRMKQAALSVLHLPASLGFLVIAGGPDGAVVGEVEPNGVARALSLRPGKYFLRARGRDELYEGEVELAASESLAVDTSGFRRVAYARLVRKGARDAGIAHGPELGISARTALPSADGPCVGPLLGYRAEWPALTVYARLTACRAGFDNGVLEATSRDLALTLYGMRAFDLDAVTLSLGVGTGLDVLHQSFDSAGRAPDRTALAPLVGVAASATLPLVGAWLLELDVWGETYFLSLQDADAAEASLRAVWSARSALLVGMLF
jgi:hypothetical protein